MQQAAALGRVLALSGGVVDVRFDTGPLPAIHNALDVLWDETLPLVLEVEAALNEHTVRTVALQETLGLARQAPVRDTGAPLAVPVGEALHGRLVNVLGPPGDGAAAIGDDAPRRVIHQAPLPLSKRRAAVEVSETDIKISTRSRDWRWTARPPCSAVWALARPCC